MNRYKRIVHVLLICLIFFGLCECVIGILQLIGKLPSGNLHYPITGTFFNPGPYCGFVASLMPLAAQNIIKTFNKFAYILSYTLVVIGMLILPITMSRTGWIAAIIGCAYVYLRERKIKLRLCNVIICTFVSCIGGIAFYLIKPASALGRIFLWKLGIYAFLDNPLFGVGWDNVAGAIGNVQESYFERNPSSIFANIASSPEYAFNEFLQIAIAYGIIAFAAFILFFILCFLTANENKEYGLAGTILSSSIVCMASYPLQFSEFIVIFAVMLISAILLRNLNLCVKLTISALVIVGSCYIVIQITERQRLLDQWKVEKFAYQSCLTDRNILELDSLYKKMYWSKDFVFDYGKALRNNHLYKKSIFIMQEGVNISSDPMFLNLIGKNYNDLNQYGSAVHYYNRSINRLPGRLYPYYLLAKLYADSSSYNKEQFYSIYDAAMQMRTKVQSPAIRQMQLELNSLYDSIDNITQDH